MVEVVAPSTMTSSHSPQKTSYNGDDDSAVLAEEYSKGQATNLTSTERKRIFRKLDWHLLPLVSLLYLLSFLYVLIYLPQNRS